MSGLPRVSGRECVRALEKAGFEFVRQRGSHVRLRREEPFAEVTVPMHRELDRGTLHAIITYSGLSVDEFRELL